MSLNICRVVTGHDDQGRAKVMIDETVKNVVSQRPGALYSVIWSSEGFPINNDAELDHQARKSAPQFPTEQYSGSSALARVLRHATIAPIRSTMPLSCRARLIWISMARWSI
jgi:hypothetical protein